MSKIGIPNISQESNTNAPQKINMEPENHLIENENNLNQTSIFGVQNAYFHFWVPNLHFWVHFWVPNLANLHFLDVSRSVATDLPDIQSR